MDRDTFAEHQRARLAVGAKLATVDASAERLERLVQQAEVAMDRLTGSAEWDGFVQIVQNRLEACKDDYEHEMYRLGHPDFRCSIEAMTRQRLHLAGLHATIAAMEWIVGLPREIMDAAEAAGMEEEEQIGLLNGEQIEWTGNTVVDTKTPTVISAT